MELQAAFEALADTVQVTCKLDRKEILDRAITRISDLERENQNLSKRISELDEAIRAQIFRCANFQPVSQLPTTTQKHSAPIGHDGRPNEARMIASELLFSGVSESQVENTETL